MRANSCSSPRWTLAVGLACALLGVATLLPTAPAGAQSDVTRLPLTGPLTFVDGGGQPVSTADFPGKWLFVYLGYMHCADLCPLGLTVMGQAIDEIGDAARLLQPLFVTVDPERDHGEPLAKFARAFHERLLGLTGSDQQIAAAAGAMGVVYRKAQQGDDYSVDHSSSYALVNPERTTVISFKQAEPHLVAQRIVSTLIAAGTDLKGMRGVGAFK